MSRWHVSEGFEGGANRYRVGSHSRKVVHLVRPDGTIFARLPPSKLAEAHRVAQVLNAADAADAKIEAVPLLYGTVHRMPTRNEYWLACTTDSAGRVVFSNGRHSEMKECRSEQEGLDWLQQLARSRGMTFERCLVLPARTGVLR